MVVVRSSAELVSAATSRAGLRALAVAGDMVLDEEVFIHEPQAR